VKESEQPAIARTTGSAPETLKKYLTGALSDVGPSPPRTSTREAWDFFKQRIKAKGLTGGTYAVGLLRNAARIS
jgi:hypothetical protein